MHGGAYVGGDKNDCRDYLEYLCSDTQQIIVNIDYERSPEAKHPTPVIQLNEAIQAAKKEIKDQADWSNISIGGNSAGAQISGEYLLALQNEEIKKLIILIRLWRTSRLRSLFLCLVCWILLHLLK